MKSAEVLLRLERPIPAPVEPFKAVFPVTVKACNDPPVRAVVTVISFAICKVDDNLRIRLAVEPAPDADSSI